MSRNVSLAQVSGLSRRDGAVLEISRAIVKGVLVPGEKLTEVRLSTQLGISRPTLREALGQLAREGLLEQEPYRGMRVAKLSAPAHLDLARTRHALDMLAVDSILADSSGGRMSVLETHWEKFSAVEEHPDPLVQHEGHVLFHRGIWEASGNTVLLKLWPVVEAHLIVSLAQDQAIRSDPARARNQHHALIDALRGRDRRAIELAFYEHTIISAEELVAIIQQDSIALRDANDLPVSLV